VTAFVAALALTPLVSRLALARGCLVPEDGARLGRRAVAPRVGGLAAGGGFTTALRALPPLASWMEGSDGPAILPLALAQLWLFWVAPIAGAALAGAAHRWLATADGR
jgi:UDP-N-acetylmuramyl pentapeptide phosphotransferase/UDP-N-acetylglucosamine-1-phosphate transferase